jgi:hypothetical protein
MIDLFVGSAPGRCRIRKKHVCVLISTIITLILCFVSPTSAASVTVACRFVAGAGAMEPIDIKKDVPLKLSPSSIWAHDDLQFKIDDDSGTVVTIIPGTPTKILGATDTLVFQDVSTADQLRTYAIDRLTGSITEIVSSPGMDKVTEAYIGNCERLGSHKF